MTLMLNCFTELLLVPIEVTSSHLLDCASYLWNIVILWNIVSLKLLRKVIVTNCISETFWEKSLWYCEKLYPWNFLWDFSITRSDISIKRIVIKHLNRIQAGRSIVATHCIKHPINLGHLHSVSLIFVQTQKSNWNESAHGCFKYLLTNLMGASPAVHRSHRLPSISLWAESLPGRWNI